MNYCIYPDEPALTPPQEAMDSTHLFDTEAPELYVSDHIKISTDKQRYKKKPNDIIMPGIAILRLWKLKNKKRKRTDKRRSNPERYTLFCLHRQMHFGRELTEVKRFLQKVNTLF